jgi:hypothetical protein
LLVLAGLVLGPACSDGDGGMLASNQGNVRVVLSADGVAATTSGTQSIGAAGAGAGSVSFLPARDEADEGGDGDRDDEGGDVLAGLTEANVTLSSLLARNLDGELVDLAIDLPQTIDLLELMGGTQIELPPGTLPPGTYDQIVVVITEVVLVRDDGSVDVLTPPGGGWTRVVDVPPFEVVEAVVTPIELSFDPSQAFNEQAGDLEFFPAFDWKQP